MPSLVVFVDAAEFFGFFPMQGIYALLTLQLLGLYLVSQRLIVLVSLPGVTARNEGAYTIYSLRDFYDSMIICYASVLAVESSDVIEKVSLSIACLMISIIFLLCSK